MFDKRTAMMWQPPFTPGDSVDHVPKDVFKSTIRVLERKLIEVAFCDTCTRPGEGFYS
jgi:hypothetical protein